MYILIFLSALMLAWAFWFIVRMFRYIHSGQYELDQRMREVCK